MSFGLGIGDLIALGQLSWKIYKKCKESSGNYAELSSEVLSLHAVVKETGEMLSQQDLSPGQKTRLTTCRQGCDDVLKDLDGLLVKYESLGTASRRKFDRMGYGMQDMNSIRLRLVSNVSMLDAFNNAVSNAKLGKQLNILIEEVRAGKREGSVISVEAFDQAAQNDRETWEALRRELEDIEAVASGQLEEDCPSDYKDNAVALYDSGVLAAEDDSDSAFDRDMESPIVAQDTSDNNPSNGAVPTTSQIPPPSRAGSVKRTPRSRLSNPVGKLRGTEWQLRNAARTGDFNTAAAIISKQTDAEKRRRLTALAIAPSMALH